MNNKISLAKEVAWASQNMPRTLRQVAALPDLSGVRLACCMHLDMKMIPLVQGILDKGAQVFLTTCNPTTVQDDVVAWLVERGAEACAWRNMSDADWQQSWEKAIAWQPTHLCEMGADITTLLHQRGEFGNIVAGLEATGSGVNRLGDIQPGYPIFNWDDLPVKEGLHNRHMVGLTAWHTFFQTTHLTLHEKKSAGDRLRHGRRGRRGGGKSFWRSGDGGGDRSCPPSAGGLRRLARGGPPGGYRLGGRGGHGDRR